MRYSKVDRRKQADYTSRISDLSKLLDDEPNPIIRDHYRNVMKQLQTKLENL